MKIAVLLALLASCVLEPSSSDLSTPPTLDAPTVWRGVDDSGAPVVLMTPQQYDALYEQIRHSQIWMRQADVALQPDRPHAH